jgi:hypothetical protein
MSPADRAAAFNKLREPETKSLADRKQDEDQKLQAALNILEHITECLEEIASRT